MSGIHFDDIRVGDLICQAYTKDGVAFSLQFVVDTIDPSGGYLVTKEGGTISAGLGDFILMDRPKPSLDQIKTGNRIQVDKLRGETTGQIEANLLQRPWTLMRTCSLEPSKAWVSMDDTEGRYWFHSHIDIGEDWVSMDQEVEVQ